jgi:hypothetical protein
VGMCRYVYNPTEQYQRTRPGTAPESCCGARTYPAVDEPELVPVAPEIIDGQAFHRMVPTGRVTARGQDDPWCPRHGGSPDPGPPPVSLAELQAAQDRYTVLVQRYQAQDAAIADAVVVPDAIGAPPVPALAPAGQRPDDPAAASVPEPDVTAAQLTDAAEHLARLTTLAKEGAS